MTAVSKLCLIMIFILTPPFTGFPNQDRPKDEAGARKTLDTYADSWNQHDTKTFASVFTEDCDYVNIGGAHWQGVEENVRQHTRLFQGRLAGVVQSPTNVQIRFPRPDVALVHTNWDVTGYTRPTGEKVDVQCRQVSRSATTASVYCTFNESQAPSVGTPSSFWTVYLHRQPDGRWLITAFQNTEVRPANVNR